MTNTERFDEFKSNVQQWATGLAAGEIGDVFDSVVVYRNANGEVFVRSLKCFKGSMNLID